MFFLYPRYSSGEIHPLLFQFSLTCIVLVIFLFSFSGLYFYGIFGEQEEKTKRALLRRGNLLFLSALILIVAMPFLILFTVGLALVGLIALVLYLAFVIEIIRQNKNMPWLNLMK